MKIELLNVSNEAEVLEYLSVKNMTYKHRSNQRMPYVERSQDELFKQLSDLRSFCFKAVENGKIIAGAGCRYLGGKSVIKGEVFWVFVDPEFHGKGIASQLMKKLEAEAKSKGIMLLNLFVFAEAFSAVNLYEKLGFQKLKIVTPKIGHSFNYEFVKAIEPYKFSQIRRILKLWISKLKYFLLFKKGNNPTILYKILLNNR